MTETVTLQVGIKNGKIEYVKCNVALENEGWIKPPVTTDLKISKDDEKWLIAASERWRKV